MLVTKSELTDLRDGILLSSDGVIGIGITATAFGAVGLIAGGIVAAMSRKKWTLPSWLPLCAYNGSLLFYKFFFLFDKTVFATASFTIWITL